MTVQKSYDTGDDLNRKSAGLRGSIGYPLELSREISLWGVGDGGAQVLHKLLRK